jgi:broad-specificity NMP kinase
MEKIFFVSGVSGVGKSSTLPILKKLLPKDKYDVRDLDERGVPDGGGLDWLKNETRHWIDIGNTNASAGKNTVICGFANPEIFTGVHKNNQDLPAVLILLNAESHSLRTRLLGRHNTPESIKEIERASSVPVSDFIKNNVEYAPKFKQIFIDAKFPIVETDNKTPEEVSKEVVDIISKRS